jgi:hypothetical protein
VVRSVPSAFETDSAGTERIEIHGGKSVGRTKSKEHIVGTDARY